MGWGGLSYDEPNAFYEADAIPDEKWKQIREKLVNKTLTVQDIKGTSLEETHFFEEVYFSCDNLKGLLDLPDTLESSLFAADDLDYSKFYLTKYELAKSRERSNVYDKWETLAMMN